MVVALVIVAIAILLLAGAAAGHVNSPSKQVHRPPERQVHPPDLDIQVRLSPEGRRLAEKYIKKHHL